LGDLRELVAKVVDEGFLCEGDGEKEGQGAKGSGSVCVLGGFKSAVI
jgi:hypothetical protein